MRPLVLGAMLAAGCAAQRLEQARVTGATATGCSARELWVIVDNDGWMTVGCGQVAMGRTVEVTAWQGPLTCELQAQFDFRLCLSMVKQGGAMDPLAAMAAAAREGGRSADCRGSF